MPHRKRMSYPIDYERDSVSHGKERVIGREVGCDDCDTRYRSTDVYPHDLGGKSREEVVQKHTKAASDQLDGSLCSKSLRDSVMNYDINIYDRDGNPADLRHPPLGYVDLQTYKRIANARDMRELWELIAKDGMELIAKDGI